MQERLSDLKKMATLHSLVCSLIESPIGTPACPGIKQFQFQTLEKLKNFVSLSFSTIISGQPEFACSCSREKAFTLFLEPIFSSFARPWKDLPSVDATGNLDKFVSFQHRVERLQMQNKNL